MHHAYAPAAPDIGCGERETGWTPTSLFSERGWHRLAAHRFGVSLVPGAASDLMWTLRCLRLEEESCGRARQAGILDKAGSGWAILAACPPSAEPRYLNLAAVTLTSMPRVTACLPFSAELGHPIRLADVPSGRSNTIEPPTLGAQYLVVRSGDPSPSTPRLLLPYDR